MSVRLRAPEKRPVHLDLRRLQRRAARALGSLGHARSELSLSLVDNAEIAELNQSWRGRKGPTDVLSFSLVEGDHARYRGAMLGDVVIGLSVAAQQARQRHRSLDDEVAHLVVHGLLHLLGFDHESSAEARVMQREERKVWRAIRGMPAA
ncbi:MAG: rRNA maturation RNase YbeY [Myxococcota bacterium]